MKKAKGRGRNWPFARGYSLLLLPTEHRMFRVKDFCCFFCFVFFEEDASLPVPQQLMPPHTSWLLFLMSSTGTLALLDRDFHKANSWAMASFLPFCGLVFYPAIYLCLLAGVFCTVYLWKSATITNNPRQWYNDTHWQSVSVWQQPPITETHSWNVPTNGSFVNQFQAITDHSPAISHGWIIIDWHQKLIAVCYSLLITDTSCS